MKPYDKPALTFEAQLVHLKRHGLTIDDRDHALAIFSHVSYYRLSAYWYPFRVRDDRNQVTDHFEDGTNFADALALYEFDRKLRPLKEQQKIAFVLTTADKRIETLQQKLDCLKQEKKALMQQLLTGKRRVTVDVDG